MFVLFKMGNRFLVACWNFCECSIFFLSIANKREKKTYIYKAPIFCTRKMTKKNLKASAYACFIRFIKGNMNDMNYLGCRGRFWSVVCFSRYILEMYTAILYYNTGIKLQAFNFFCNESIRLFNIGWGIMVFTLVSTHVVRFSMFSCSRDISLWLHVDELKMHDSC